MNVADLDELSQSLSAGALSTDADVLEAYSKDEALFCPHDGAIALVRAKTVDDVVTTMKFAHTHRIPVVPQGARSGISGGANAVPGAILLNVASMDRILEVNTAERTVCVEPGVINLDLKKHLTDFDLSYPPDPGSVAISSIGGNISTNAGGMCCVKYGVTRDWVRSITVVLADGSITTFGPQTAKGVAGLDMRGLFIGSEGTLGIVVQATLRLIPKLTDPVTAVAVFPTEKAGLQAVADFMAAGGQPSLFEFLDRACMEMLNDLGDFGLDASAGSMLLVQFDQRPAEATAALADFERVAKACGATDVAVSDDPTDSEALVATRRMIQPAFEKYAHAHGGGQLLDDVCIPRAKMPEFCDRLDEVRRDTGLMIAVVAHAGDGNTHPSVFFDASDPQETAVAQRAFDTIMEIGLELGGTITGEHGVGYLKSAWLAKELDSTNRAAQLAVKQALDPLGILNPGKMFAQLF